jgi:predicted transcriptional regulator
MRRAALGNQELEVFQYVAERAPIAVGDVAREFGAQRGLARTTILTVMERLRRKGYLRRRKVEGVYQYSPSVAKSDVLRSLVRDFAQRVLGGSSEPFMAYLLEDAELSEAEIEDLRKLVAERSAKGERRRR